MRTDIYYNGSSHELESILDALAEINVQLRQVLNTSQIVKGKLETGSRDPNPTEEVELETKSQSILSNMARTEEAIRNMNQEISSFLRNRPVDDRIPAEI